MPKYIADQPIELPIPVQNEDKSERTFPQILTWLINLYQPSQTFQLKNLGERRALNHAVDVLSDPRNGVCVLDTGEFDLVKSVVENVGLTLLQGLDRNLPNIMDALEAAPDSSPS